MKADRLLLAALGIVSFGIASVAVAGNRPQPAAPPIPPSWRQPPAPAPQPAPQPSNQQQSDPNSTDNNQNNNRSRNSSNNGNGSGSSQHHDHQDRNNQNQNPYGYGYPYGNPYYGQPTAGVYYPGSSIGTSNGNPNAMPQNNPNANNGQPLFNDAPAPPDPKPTPTPVAATPPPPPDPELIQANEDVSAAMDALRQQLLKSDPDYQAAVAAKKAAQENSASVHANESSTPDQILTAATQVLDASRRVVEIERAAAATDPQVVDAQSKLKTALAAHMANAAAK